MLHEQLFRKGEVSLVSQVSALKYVPRTPIIQTAVHTKIESQLSSCDQLLRIGFHQQTNLHTSVLNEESEVVNSLKEEVART